MEIRTNQFINRKKGDFEKLQLNHALMGKIVEDMRLHAGTLMPLNHWHLVEKEEDVDDLAVPDSSIADQYDRSMKEQYYNAETMLDAWIGCTGMQDLASEDIRRQEDFLQKIDSIGMLAAIKNQRYEAYDYRKQDLATVAEVNLLYAGMQQRIDRKQQQGIQGAVSQGKTLCEKKTIFLEVGGGYGRIAEAVMNVFSGVKYVMLDAVPGSLLYAYEYLRNMLAEQRVGFFYQGDKFDLDQFDVYILPAWHFEECNPYKYDCCINISSMQEMGQEHVDYYLDLFDRVLKSGGIAYIRNSRDYVFKGEWRYSKCWKRLFMYNLPSSWTDYYPAEIFRKEEADCSLWNQCVIAGYEYALYEKQQRKENVNRVEYMPGGDCPKIKNRTD